MAQTAAKTIMPRTTEGMWRRRAMTNLRLTAKQADHFAGGKLLALAERRAQQKCTVVTDVSEASGTSLVDIFKSDAGHAIDLARGNFLEIYKDQVLWLVDRLKKSTAGFRGVVMMSELEQIRNDITAEVKAHAAKVNVRYRPQDLDKVCLAVFAMAMQGLANYIKADYAPGERRIFISGDVRMGSNEYAELSMRVMIANGIETYADVDGTSATPVTSYMAKWLSTRKKFRYYLLELARLDQLWFKWRAKNHHGDVAIMLVEESGGLQPGPLGPLFNRVKRWFIRSAGAVEITSSHNPFRENGGKVSDSAGGVETDDRAGREAEEITRLYNDGTGAGCIYIAGKKEIAKRLHYVDAKEIYWENYGKYIFTREAIERLAAAVESGHRYLFDGLGGVGGKTMHFFIKKFEEVLGKPGAVARGVTVANDQEDMLLGKIVFPDPTKDNTLDEAGDLTLLAMDKAYRALVLADADADRSGPAEKTTLEKVGLALRYGLFVSKLVAKGLSEPHSVNTDIFDAFICISRYLKAECGIKDLAQATEIIGRLARGEDPGVKIDLGKLQDMITARGDATELRAGSAHAPDDGRTMVASGIDPRNTEAARKSGLSVDEVRVGGVVVPIVRYTANQLGALMAFARTLDYVEQRYKIHDQDEAIQAIKSKKYRGRGIDLGNLHYFTTIASSRLLAALAHFVGGVCNMTAVGFKYLGRQVGKLESRDTVLAHHDKDTSILALLLYTLDAKLALKGQTLLDLYIKMAQNLDLFYYHRTDVYFRDEAHKEETVKKALELETECPALIGQLFDKRVVRTEPDQPVKGVTLFVEEGTAWADKNPTATRYTFADESYAEVYHAGAAGKDGPCLTFYDKKGNILYWVLIRQSGTEPLARIYTEIVEKSENPRVENLLTRFDKILHYLDVHNCYVDGKTGNPPTAATSREDITDILTYRTRTIQERYLQAAA